MRWSAAYGIRASFRQGVAAYYTLAPLSTKLMNGPAQVPTYDVDLNPTYAPQTFSGIDLDAWAQAYLLAVDEVLSPATAVAIAALDGAAYQRLMTAKEHLAQALAKGVIPVFPDAPAGDPAAAQDQFEQSVLAALSTAYAVSSVVQVRADVSVAGTAEPGALPPRFFGSVGVPGAQGNQAREYSITGGKLPIQATSDDHPGYLTFLVTVAQPGRLTHLELPLAYRARFVEHLLDPAEADYGYVPSEWLRFVLDPADDPLTMPLGTVDAPVPVRAFPASPVLQGQRAEQTPAPRGAADADPGLAWDYTADLVHANQDAQDDLWVNVTYNLPVTRPPARAAMLASPLGTIEAVFEALASFTVAWPVLRPFVTALPEALSGGGGGGPTPAQVIAALLEQVEKVSQAWGALRGIVDRRGQLIFAAGAPGDAPPPPLTDAYVVSFADAFRPSDPVLHVFAQAKPTPDGCDEAGIVWPAINGQSHGPVTPAGAGAPDATGCWYRADYPYAALPDQPPGALRIGWQGLDVLARQTGCSTWWIVRNADLSGTPGMKTDPRLVYQTPNVSFASPVVPLIVVPQRTFPAGSTLAGTLEDALSLFATAGGAAGKERLLKVALTYRYPLVSPGGGGAAVWSDSPVLLADHVQLATGPSQGGDAVTLQQLAARLASDATTWYGVVTPATGSALLSLTVVLFTDVDGTQLPIIRAPDRDISVPQGWWPQS
jgi:hypothetical protein